MSDLITTVVQNNNVISTTISGDNSVNSNVISLGITPAIIGLGNVDNTSDANKPISIATQAALNTKQPVGNYSTGGGTATGTNTGDQDLSGYALTSSLSTVTVDATVIDGSTNSVSGNAVFDALALKAPLISPSFTTPTLGVATATTINNLAITAAANSTLTIEEDKGITLFDSITTDFAGYINTSGGGYIVTGVNGYIYTNGWGYIHTGVGGHIQTGDGGFISTTAGGSFATGTGNLTGPNASGTVALTNPSSGTQTFSGAQSFSSTTRPTSSGTGTPAATSLITLADGDARYGATGLAGTSAISITSQITPQTIRSAELAVGLYHIRMVFLLAGTANTGTRHGYDFSGTSTVRFFRSRASSPTLVQVTSNPFDQPLTEANTSAVIEGIISVTVAGTFSMQAAQNTSHPDVLSVGASNHMIITPCPKGSIS